MARKEEILPPGSPARLSRSRKSKDEVTIVIMDDTSSESSIKDTNLNSILNKPKFKAKSKSSLEKIDKSNFKEIKLRRINDFIESERRRIEINTEFTRVKSYETIGQNKCPIIKKLYHCKILPY